jgi:hypothetical protein
MIPTLRPHRPRPAPPLDLRFIDLFMALVLALVFLALLLMIVAGSVRPGLPGPPDDQAGQLRVLQDRLAGAEARVDRLTADNTRLRSAAGQVPALQRQATELQRQLDETRTQAQALGVQNRRLQEQVERVTTNLRLPWWLTWLLVVNGVVGVLAVIAWSLVRVLRARGGMAGQLLRLAGWLAAAVAVAVVARLVLHVPEQVGFALRVPWWAFVLLGAGQLLGLRYTWLVLRGRMQLYRYLRRGEDLQTIRVPL